MTGQQWFATVKLDSGRIAVQLLKCQDFMRYRKTLCSHLQIERPSTRPVRHLCETVIKGFEIPLPRRHPCGDIL